MTQKQREVVKKKKTEHNAKYFKANKLEIKAASQKTREYNLSLAKKGLNINGKPKGEESEGDEMDEMVKCGFCREEFELSSILRHISRIEACKVFYGSDFTRWKKDHRKIRMRYYRNKYGTEKELEQKRTTYASISTVRENKKDYYGKCKKEQELLEKEEKKRSRMEHAEKSLQRSVELAKRENSKGFKWLKDSFEKVFNEYKIFDNATKEKIVALEQRIERKNMMIEAEIDYKIKKYEAEMTQELLNDFPTVWHIFDEFTIVTLSNSNWGKPLREQNRIALNWHELKQTIEIKLEDISKEIGKPLYHIPWHTGVCKICNIYRHWKTGIKYIPPRFAHEQDLDMIPLSY